MVTDIQGIKQTLSGGLQRPNKFRLNFPIAPVMLNVPYYNALYQVSQNIEYHADSIDLVGVDLQTVPIQRFGYGPAYEIPIGSTFQNIMVTFYVDHVGAYVNYFQTWTNCIHNFNMEQGITATDDLGLSNAYELYYAEDYVVDMSMTLLNVQNQDVVTYNVRRAFPKSVAVTKMAWNINSDVQRLTVIFAYRDWYINWSAGGTMVDSLGVGVNYPAALGPQPTGSDTFTTV